MMTLGGARSAHGMALAGLVVVNDVRRVSVTVLLAFFCGMGCERSKPESVAAEAPQKPLSGEDIYRDKCRSCHGSLGTGSEHVPALIGDRRAPSIEELGARLHTGGERMPSFKSISREDIESVAMYLRTVGGDGPWPEQHEHSHEHGCPLKGDAP